MAFWQSEQLKSAAFTGLLNVALIIFDVTKSEIPAELLNTIFKNALLKRNKKSSNSAETQRAYNAEFLHMSHYGLHKSEIPQLHPLQ